MSSSTTNIERKIAQDNVPATMPNQFRDACAQAYCTNILNLSYQINMKPIVTTATDLRYHIIPFLNHNPNISHLTIRLYSLESDEALSLANTTTLKAITFLWSDLETDIANGSINIPDDSITDEKIRAVMRNWAKRPYEPGEQFLDALLSSENQTIMHLYGIHLTPEIENFLHINRERATPEECRNIIASLQGYLTKDVLPIVLEYRGINSQALISNPSSLDFNSSISIILNSTTEFCKRLWRQVADGAAETVRKFARLQRNQLIAPDAYPTEFFALTFQAPNQVPKVEEIETKITAEVAFFTMLQSADHPELYLDYFPDVDVNALNPEGETALHIAVRKGNLALIKVLVEHGADTEILNSAGKTVWELATDRQELMAALTEAMPVRIQLP